MRETPHEMADRIEADSLACSGDEDRDYGLAIAGIIRKEADAGGKRRRSLSALKEGDMVMGQMNESVEVLTNAKEPGQ